MTTFGYNERNRKVWMDSPIAADRNSTGHTMNWVYDGVGNKLKETRADDAFRSWGYDVPNRTTTAIDWRSSTSEPAVTTRRTRDLPDPNQTDVNKINFEHVYDAKNAEYKFESDAAGRKIRETYPLDAGNTVRFVYWHYDAAGNVDQYYNPASQIKTMSYDNRNRLISAWWNAGGGKTLTYTYDPANRMTSVVTGVNETTVAFGYDDANRQISEDQTLAGYPPRHIDMPRDHDGNRDYLFVPGYYLLYYDYTARNQLAHINDGNNDPVWTYTYDQAGNVTNRFGQWGLPNGVNFAYDALNRVEQVEQGNAAIVFARSHYQYDKVSREVATWRDGPQDEAGIKGERFWYTTNNQVKDAWYRASNVWTAAPSSPATYRGYTYTPNMLNWSSVNDNGYNAPFVANDLNQYTSVNGSVPHYDDRFNLNQFGAMQYPHDSANQLTSATGNGHSGSFTYDGLGRCVKRTIDGVTRLFTYDAWNPIIEFDGAGNWKAMNLYGTGADEILGRYDATLAHLIYKQDKQGNVMFVLNSSNQIVEKYSYDAYGQPTIMDGAGNSRSASAIGNRFMYTGREWIGELGIYDYRHRYYFPGIGRFLETDPMGLQTEGEKLSAGQKALFSPGGSAPEAFSSSEMNLFRYCGDDPVDNSDPMGLEIDPQPAKRVPIVIDEHGIKHPGLFGKTSTNLKADVQLKEIRKGVFKLDPSKSKLTIKTQIATEHNGQGRSDRAILATETLHEPRHSAAYEAWHSKNIEHYSSAIFADINAANAAATVLGNSLISSINALKASEDLHEPRSVWAPIERQER